MQCLNLRLTRDDLSRPWGFRLQGGLDSEFPLSVQRVFSGSPAEGVLQRGDVIKSLDNCETQCLSAKEVQDIIRSSTRQLDCNVERDSNQNNFQDLIDDSEPKVSVKTARKKFQNTENIAPKPFGGYGTYFVKKNDSVPTNVKLDMENQYKLDQTRNYDDQTEEVDDKVDYSFMTLSVNERKKLFATPDDNESHPATRPRLRSHSVRPIQRPVEGFTANALCDSYIDNRCYGMGERINSRTIIPSQYPIRSPPSRIMGQNILAESYSNDPHQNPSNSSQIRQDHQSVFNLSPIELKIEVPPHVYRCGASRQISSNETRCSDGRPLIVKTYQISSASSPLFPRSTRTEYCTPDNNRSHTDRWSNIIIGSRQLSINADRRLTYNYLESDRFNQNATSIIRDTSTNLGLIKLGEPRLISQSLDPYFCPNKSMPSSNHSTRPSYDQPTNHYLVMSNPVAMNTPTMPKDVSVSRSHSNIIIDPRQHAPNNPYSNEYGFHQRENLERVSDF